MLFYVGTTTQMWQVWQQSSTDDPISANDDLNSNQIQPTLLNRLNLVLTPARYATLNYQYPTDCGESLLDIWKLKTHISSWCVKLIIEYPLLMGQ